MIFLSVLCVNKTPIKKIWKNKTVKKFIAILLLSLTNSAYALPNCLSDVAIRWHNCFGTDTWADGTKYVGEFKASKYHGQGALTSLDGTQYNGYFMNGDFVPGICEDKGLSQGTSEFEQCVIELMDNF